jgi:hypothetical protein
LPKWLITGLKEQEIKQAREAFQPKFKTKEDKHSIASKSNVDAKEKEYRKLSYKILDLGKPLLFLNGRTKQRRKYKSDVKAIRMHLRGQIQGS